MERRRFFENYAKENQFDPLVPTNWYTQPIHRILEFKVCSIFSLFYSLLFLALFYPLLSHSNHTRREQRKWCRSTAAAFRKHSSICSLTLVSIHFSSQVWFFHKTYSLMISLCKSYVILFLGSWKSVGSRRKFFVSYAKANGFDPLVAEHWYSQSRTKIDAVKVCK